MKNMAALFGVFLVFMCMATPAPAGRKKSKDARLTGTWECVSHGSSAGDMQFTLDLEQNDEDVTGTFTSPAGSTEISSGSFRKNMLEIQISFHALNAPENTYTLMGVLKKGELSGTWSTDTEKGSWEGKKQAAESQK